MDCANDLIRSGHIDYVYFVTESKRLLELAKEKIEKKVFLLIYYFDLKNRILF